MSNSTNVPARLEARVLRRGAVGFTATALVVAAIAFAQPATAATAPVSQSQGRFLSGLIGASNLDTVAAIEGETAQNYGGATVRHSNSLNASALNGAVNLPLTGVLQLPGADTVQLGAVNQMAQAAPDGSAMAASGAVSNSGGISAGGSTGAPANATVDLAGIGGAAVAQLLGNLKLTVGAVAARADQAAVGGPQTGTYQLAGLTIDLTSPALASLTGPLTAQLTDTLQALATRLQASPLGVITVTGLDQLPSAASALTSLELGNGAITANLTTGSIHIDVAALLASLGLDLNHLPANTHLLPYLSRALSSTLPTALSSLLASLQARYLTAFGNLGFSIGATPLNASQLAALTPLLIGVRAALTSAFARIGQQASAAAFTPLASALGSVLDIIVNGQHTTAGTFTEQAFQLDLGSAAAGVQLVLASASVGPGTLAPAADATPPASSTSVAAGRSPIRIDAGRPGDGSAPRPWFGALAVLLIAGSAAGFGSLRRRTVPAAPPSGQAHGGSRSHRAAHRE